jgi:hypothetical protein
VSAAAIVQVCKKVRQEAAPEKVKFPAVLISPVQFKSCVWERHNPAVPRVMLYRRGAKIEALGDLLIMTRLL